jgi:hypothetical protein
MDEGVHTQRQIETKQRHPHTLTLTLTHTHSSTNTDTQKTQTPKTPNTPTCGERPSPRRLYAVNGGSNSAGPPLRLLSQGQRAMQSGFQSSSECARSRHCRQTREMSPSCVVLCWGGECGVVVWWWWWWWWWWW